MVMDSALQVHSNRYLGSDRFITAHRRMSRRPGVDTVYTRVQERNGHPPDEGQTHMRGKPRARQRMTLTSGERARNHNPQQ